MCLDVSEHNPQVAQRNHLEGQVVRLIDLRGTNSEHIRDLQRVLDNVAMIANRTIELRRKYGPLVPGDCNLEGVYVCAKLMGNETSPAKRPHT